MSSIHAASWDRHAGLTKLLCRSGACIYEWSPPQAGPMLLTPALRRMGRLDSEVAISLPTPEVCPASSSPGPANAPACLALDQHRIVLTGDVHVQEREAIVRLHSKGLPLGADVELDSVARVLSWLLWRRLGCCVP